MLVAVVSFLNFSVLSSVVPDTTLLPAETIAPIKVPAKPSEKLLFDTVGVTVVRPTPQ